jgi:hypothetical protein
MPRSRLPGLFSAIFDTFRLAGAVFTAVSCRARWAFHVFGPYQPLGLLDGNGG